MVAATGDGNNSKSIINNSRALVFVLGAFLFVCGFAVLQIMSLSERISTVEARSEQLLLTISEMKVAQLKDAERISELLSRLHDVQADCIRASLAETAKQKK